MRLFIRCVSDRVRLGPGKVQLLELIDRHGSISEAARMMDMSYRRAWLLVAELNQGFRQPVVAAQTGGKGGGHAGLTDFGREIVKRYRAIEQDARKAVAKHLDALSAELSDTPAQ
ncbi:MAG TPA: LysR family transcriptional regulator [Alphaproteobacteria bacterium]|nr:LysR family transcriptional regulator [Alphaproteobacteria bacterium]